MSYCPKCGKELTTKIIDENERLVCETCNYTEWNNPIPVVAALVRYREQYILARNKQWPKGYFSLIAGYLESGETIEEAVLREVKEELNLTGEVTNILGCYSFFEKNQLIVAFEVNGAGQLQPNEELSELKLLSKDELSKYDFGYFEITQQIMKSWTRLHGLD